MPPPRRSASGREEAFRILLQVETTEAYSSLLLRELPEGMDLRERSLSHELVLGALRWQGWIDHALAQFARRRLGGLDPAVRVALRLGAYQMLRLSRVPAWAAVNESVRLARRAAGRSGGGFVNAVLRALARGTPQFPGPDADPVERLAVGLSHPTWLVARWVRRMGEGEAAKALEANNRPAPTVLRASRLRGGREALVARLLGHGVRTEPGRWSPEAVRVAAGRPPAELFQEGWFCFQDEASQIVATLVDPRPGERILDLCAAPGGKATDLAERLGVHGILVAADRRLSRLGMVRDGGRRLGLVRLQLLVQDGARPALRAAGFDRVLVDAPCTGTGTLRRHPEIRWRRREADVTALAVRQRALLSAAAGLVRSGGTVVYSVCSLEPEEGPDVVTALLAERPEFLLENPAAVPGPLSPELISGGRPGPHLRTLPHRHDMDGFFAAVLRRKG